MRRWMVTLGALSLLFVLTTEGANAAEPLLTYRHRHFLYSVRSSPAWRTRERVWTFQGKPFTPSASLLVDGDDVPPLPAGILVDWKEGWNRAAIRSTLASAVTTPLFREPGNVIIKRPNGTGAVVFEGVGLPGRSVDLDRAVNLTIMALEQGIIDIVLPVTETQPRITVEDPTLEAEGVAEVVTVGESDFSNSPSNRRHNIATGLKKFNGTLIPAGSVFSFNAVLGPVDGTTGYKKELVIKGDRTVPDYGGGLCQVSTTAYRGIWEYGFPITQRKNHSYTVSHYFPQGTDATVYPPGVDMKFKNDSPGSLLIQTHAEGDLAYFIYYGTKDARRSQIIGPFIWDRRSPPPDRTEYTTDLKPGERKKLGERIPGLKALWYRVTKTGTGETVESVFSSYEARPLFYLVGTEKLRFGTGSGSEIPSVFLED